MESQCKHPEYELYPQEYPPFHARELEPVNSNKYTAINLVTQLRKREKREIENFLFEDE